MQGRGKHTLTTRNAVFSSWSVPKGYKKDKEDPLGQLSFETPACQDMSLGAVELRHQNYWVQFSGAESLAVKRRLHDNITSIRVYKPGNFKSCEANIALFCWIWGSHDSGYEKYCFPGCNAVESGRSRPMFSRNVLSSTSGSKNKPSKQ
jgi:hypothetical protein